MRIAAIVLTAAAFWSVVGVAPAAEPGDWDDPNWQLLREAQVPRANAGLIAYLRDQCGDDADLGRVDALVRQLGSDDFDEREKATKQLPAVGVPALAKLRAAQSSGDAETSRRALECIAQIEKKWKPELALAAVRVLVRRGCVEAIPALVRFLPCVDFEQLDDAVWFGLDSLTMRQGKIDPSLMDALASPIPVRRAAAACIVGRRGDAGQRAAVRKLLTDTDAEVRLRAAQGLLAAKDKTAAPTLIALLVGTTVETAWQAEELLRYVAGQEAPREIIGAGGVDARRACRKEWEAWWKEHEADVDFTKLDGTSRRPGLMLLCDGGLPEEATGRVWLLGCDGVTRWELRQLSNPADALFVGGGRVVVAERRLAAPDAPAKQIAETGVSARGLDGKVVWRYEAIDDPLLCQPLDDGRILIAGSKFVIAEVDLAGKECVRKDFSTKAYPAIEYDSLLGDRRIITCRPKAEPNAREWQEVEPVGSGRTLNYPSWPSCFDYVMDANGLRTAADAELANDCVVVEAITGRVEQFGDPNPRSLNPWIWKVRIPGAVQAAKLPNGSVLAGGVGRAVEIDREGRAVWSASFEEQAQRVRPCLHRVRIGYDAPRAELALGANQSAWLQGLSSKEAAIRRRTADAIGVMRRWGLEAGPTLIPLLKDPDETVRGAARGALARIYPVIPAAVRKAARDKNPRVRQDVLTKDNFEPRPLENVESDARNGLLKDEWFEFFMELMRDKDPEIRLEGVDGLGGDELHTQEALSVVIEATHDQDARVRATAVTELGQFGSDGRAGIPALVACLKDEDPQVRGWSAQALGEIDPLDDRAFPALLDAVQDKDGNRFAGYALRRCKPRAKEAVQVLVKMLDATNLPKATPLDIEGVRDAVFFSLRRLAPGTDSVVPALAALVRDKSVEGDLRIRAAQTLGEIGPAAKAAVPDLLKAKSEKELERVAAEAIDRIQDE